MTSSSRRYSAVFFVILLVCGFTVGFQQPRTSVRWLLGRIAVVGGLFGLVGVPLRKRSARKILDLNKSIYSEVHELAVADASAFAGLDRAFYDRMQAELRARGFRQLADVEDVTMKRLLPSMHSVIRVMLSEDGTIAGGMYHLRVRGWQRLLQVVGVIARRMKIVDLDTELTDGTSITTSDSLGLDRSAEVPGFLKNRLAPGTPLDEMLRQHRESVRSVLSARPSVGIVRITNFRKMIASHRRLQALKIAYKRSIGYVDRRELEAVRGRPLKEGEEAILADIESLKKAAESSGGDQITGSIRDARGHGDRAERE